MALFKAAVTRGANPINPDTIEITGRSVIYKKRRIYLIGYDTIVIPFSKISKKGISGLSNLSIGIVTAPPNIPIINNTITDVSGESALGDATARNKTLYVPSTNNSTHIPQADRYSRSRPGVPTPSRINDFWVKVHLNTGK